MTERSVADQIIVGVDTHKDVHVAVAIDGHGRLLGHRSVATTEKGCRDLHQELTSKLVEIAAEDPAKPGTKTA